MTSDEFNDIEQLDENLKKWFKEKWVRFGPDGKIRGACARGSDSEGKPKCLPQSKAHNLGKKGRKYAASKKRREDPNPERTGKAKNVATKKKTNEELNEKCPHCGGELVSEEMMNEKQDACYRKVKSRYKVWPSAYASGALVQCRKKGASNWGTGGKKTESYIMKGIVGEAFNPKQRAEEIKKIVSFIVDYIGDDPSDSAIADAAKGEADRSKAEYKAKRSDGFLSSDDIFEPLWNHFREQTEEASSPAQQAAIAINMKKKGQKPKNDVQEDYTGMYAAEKTSKINPYGGRPDRQFRGAINETPSANPTGASGEGGRRKYKPKSAGTLKEDGSNLEAFLSAYPEAEEAMHNAVRHFEYAYDAMDHVAGHVLHKIPYSEWRKVRQDFIDYFVEHGLKPDVNEDTAYAGGMGQGGNSGQSYRKFTPKMAGVVKKESAIMKGIRKEGR